MKNHTMVNGKLLQTYKKWSNLRQKQKDHISNWLCRDYIQFVRTHHRKPRKNEHDEIFHEVMNQIQEQEIWIPYGEVKKYYVSKIGKWFRKIEGEWEIQIDNNERQQVLKEK
ncbi:transposase [Bacillus cereus]|uniref:Transposase n=2 Tax=Bacillus cereus group TaxID=86661 RepID=A0A2B0VMR3_BACAN|nr:MULTISPECIES: hypothetical protein [Bacillus]MCU0096478.1 transposase [Bacillus sp. OR9]KZD28884.1 hypothetical protein B4082_4645 [Bacillus cereus]MBJ8062262.1 transposase [Bacillus cereus]MCU4759308.1 transposase [Bacillus cereus]MCU4992645.1 transposase [Bacillus cereus]